MKTVPWIVSGTPETKLSESGHFVRWNTREVKVVLDPSLDRLGESARDAVMLGFGAWVETSAELPNLTFEVANQPLRAKEDGTNSVSYGPIKVEGHEKDVAITVAHRHAYTGEILEADMIVNNKYPFGVLKAEGASTDSNEHRRHDHDHKGRDETCFKRYDVQDVISHEAGHFFGLGEDHEQELATMFFKTALCETKKRDLYPSDEATVLKVYEGASKAEASTAQGCSTTTAKRGERTPVAAVLGFFLVCGLLRRKKSV